MSKVPFKFYKQGLLVPAIGLGAVYLTSLFTHFAVPLSVIAVLGVLVFLMDRWLWHVFPFKLLFEVEDFRGTYEGLIEYQFRDADCNVVSDRLKHVKVIQQTGSTIEIFSFTYDKNGEPSTPSVSGEISFCKTDNGVVELTYTYRNKGSVAKEFSQHMGTEMVKVIREGNKLRLTGEYFTNRIPYQTKGSYIDLVRKTTKMEHPF
jgi:hypothetical protein